MSSVSLKIPMETLKNKGEQEKNSGKYSPICYNESEEERGESG